MKRMVIFGAGKYGKTAIQFYKDSQNIDFIVDNSPSLWGSCLLGYDIKCPDVLRDIDKDKVFVLVAMHRIFEESIVNQLKEFGIKYYAMFHILSTVKTLSPFSSDVEKRIVSFCGGLGNQLFQYTFYKCLEQRSRFLCADLSPYLFDKRDFVLDKVFSGIKLTKLDLGAVSPEYFAPPLLIDEFKCEALPPVQADMSVFDINRGYFRGFWQRYQFAKMAEKALRQDLTFRDKDDRGLRGLIGRIRAGTYVSLHVRHGDYMSAACRSSFGGVCDAAYYERAVSYIKDRDPSARFMIFTEDPEWARENLAMPDSTIVTGDMFDDYEDWYDMQLMSLCRHNIIANSTFSWWGAWLNASPDKIVVAPKRWRLDRDVLDICPPEWVRL